MREMVEDAIDSMKISSDPIDAILVGGGAVLLPHDLAGTKSVACPEFAGCANAIGSAISKVSGMFEKLVDYEETGREEALEHARREAIAAAVRAGADEATVRDHRLRGWCRWPIIRARPAESGSRPLAIFVWHRLRNSGGSEMLVRQMLEIYDLLDTPQASGEAVAALLRERGAQDVTVTVARRQSGYH